MGYENEISAKWMGYENEISVLSRDARRILLLNLIEEKRSLVLSSLCLGLTVNILLFILDFAKQKQF